MGQKNFFVCEGFFVCSDKSLLICVFSYNTLPPPLHHTGFKKRCKSIVRICIFRFFPYLLCVHNAIGAIIKCGGCQLYLLLPALVLHILNAIGSAELNFPLLSFTIQKLFVPFAIGKKMDDPLQYYMVTQLYYHY